MGRLIEERMVVGRKLLTFPSRPAVRRKGAEVQGFQGGKALVSVRQGEKVDSGPLPRCRGERRPSP